MSEAARANPVAQFLARLQETGGLKGTDIANFAGVSKATVSRWNSGRKSPHPRTQLIMSDLSYVVMRLGEYYGQEEVRAWLYARHPQLGRGAGDRPYPRRAHGRGDRDTRSPGCRRVSLVMARERRRSLGGIRDRSPLDALEAVPMAPFAGTVWRSARAGRGPLVCGRTGGRWDDGTLDVLYTSETREGAVAERRFHLFQGQPFPPSRVRYEMFELWVSLGAVMRFAGLEALADVGLRVAGYGPSELPRTRAGVPANSGDCRSVCVPRGRWVAGSERA